MTSRRGGVHTMTINVYEKGYTGRRGYRNAPGVRRSHRSSPFASTRVKIIIIILKFKSNGKSLRSERDRSWTIFVCREERAVFT